MFLRNLPSIESPDVLASRSDNRPGHFRRHDRRGFSLVELMVVVVIIGVLSTVVTIGVRNYLTLGKQNAAKAEVAKIVQALDSYFVVYDRYPTNEEGLAILAQPTKKLPQGLLNKIPVDPWGHPYEYNQPGQRAAFEVISYGADGREGGEGADADILSWDMKN